MRTLAIRVALAALALAVVGAAAYAAAWYSAANGLRTNIAGALATHGGTLGSVAISGFPGTIELTADTARLPLPGVDGWQLVARDLRVRSPFTGGDPTFTVGGATLTFRGGSVTADAEPPAVGIWKANAVSLAARNVSLRWHDDAVWKVARLRTDIIPGAGTGAIPDGTRLILAAEGLSVPSLRRGPFGDTADTLNVGAQLQQGALKSFDEAGVKAWRDGGGRVSAGVQVRWGTLDAETTGFYRLDTDGRPVGTTRALVGRILEVVDALLAARWIDAAARDDLVKAANFAMPADGGRVVVPLDLKDGGAWYATTRVVDLPVLLP